MIYDKIKKDQLEARKSKNKKTTSILTTLLGEIELDIKGVSGGINEVSDDMAISKIKKFIKSMEEVVALLPAGSENQVKALQEIDILKPYLPKQLTEKEISIIIKESGLNNMGEVMKMLKEQYSGLYNGKVASKLAKEIL